MTCLIIMTHTERQDPHKQQDWGWATVGRRARAKALCPTGTPEQKSGASRILQPLFYPQVEMFLLAYAVRHTIQVYRLSKYGTEEFITVYPTDPPGDWPVVTLIAEDDRHYNVPVRVCEETSL